MVQRQAVTKTNATRYKRADKAGKGLILDELCSITVGACHSSLTPDGPRDLHVYDVGGVGSDLEQRSHRTGQLPRVTGSPATWQSLGRGHPAAGAPQLCP